MKILRLKALFISITFLSPLTACKDVRKLDNKKLRMPLGTDAPNLDPQIADTGVSVFLLKQVLSTLFDYDPQHKIIVYDAESFKWDSVGKTLSIKVRNDLFWSDGQKLTACQYRDGILRALDPAIPSTLSELLFDIEGARDRKSGKVSDTRVGVSCDDVKNLLVLKTLRSRPAKVLHALAFIVSAPVRKDRIKLLALNWVAGDSKHPGIGTGAFIVKEWSHERRIILESRAVKEKNLPQDRHTKLDQVQLPIIRDATSALAMYSSGEADFIDEIPPILLEKYKDRKDAVVSPYFTTYMIGVSLKSNPLLKDKRIRKAIAYCANQPEVPALLQGGEIESRGWIPPGLLPSEAQPSTVLYNPAVARELLNSAGFENPEKFPRLKLFFNVGDRHTLLMERFANNLKTCLGIKIDLEPMDWKVLVSTLKTNPPDLYRYAWTAVYPDPVFFLEIFDSKSFNNFGGWKNADFDSIVRDLAKVPIESRGEKFWMGIKRAQEILVSEDPGVIPLYHYVRNALVKPYVHGLELSGMGTGYLRKVWIEGDQVLSPKAIR